MEIIPELAFIENGSAPSGSSFRVVIVLPALGAGGTEHVVSVLANQWAARGWSVTIVTLEPPEASTYYSFHPDVQIKRLGMPPGRRPHFPALVMSAKRIRLLRTTLRETAPDVAFSFLTRTNVMTLIAARRLGFSVVVSERNNPALQNVGPIWRTLRAKLYPSAFGLVTMTNGALQYFDPKMRKRSWVIPNPVDLPATIERKRGGNILTAVGRLVPQKGFDLLLKAFAQVSSNFPEWTLVIWGEGPDRSALEAERDRLGLRGRVELPGVTSRPGIWVDTADAFVLSSRFEGWGIALLEAMAADLPVISFDCEWGPREMIEDEHSGLLVEPGNVDALAGALRRVLGDGSLRNRLAAAAGPSARRFTPQHIMKQWDEVAHAALRESFCWEVSK
jgi:glycosyltransferase involved in cell wall biosynthesis